MCWTGKEYPKIVQDGEQINVSKIVCYDNNKGAFVPYFFKNKHIENYKVGKTYQEDFCINHSMGLPYMYCYIKKGIHSYMSNMVRIRPLTEYGNKYNGSIDYRAYDVEVSNLISKNPKVFKFFQRYRYSSYVHSLYYDRYEIGKQPHHLCLLSGHIPPGGTYYVNNNGEVVSDMLTVDFITPFYWGLQSEISKWKK